MQPLRQDIVETLQCFLFVFPLKYLAFCVEESLSGVASVDCRLASQFGTVAEVDHSLAKQFGTVARVDHRLASQFGTVAEVDQIG